MLAKGFKGGRLDDFLSAGEAEAKYGPQRYAAVYDDLRKVEVQKERDTRQREYSKKPSKSSTRGLTAVPVTPPSGAGAAFCFQTMRQTCRSPSSQRSSRGRLR